MQVQVEHEVVAGETVLDEFENVEKCHNPPMGTIHLWFSDDRDSKTLRSGYVVKAEI